MHKLVKHKGDCLVSLAVLGTIQEHDPRGTCSLMPFATARSSSGQLITNADTILMVFSIICYQFP